MWWAQASSPAVPPDSGSYGAHVAASILVGLIFRFYGGEEPDRHLPSRSHEIRTVGFAEASTGSVKNAFSATLSICGFVIFFTVLIRLLFYTGIISLFAAVLTWLLRGFGMQQAWAECLLTGAIEMTSGVWSLRDMAGAMGDRLCMAAFILGWAGLSVHCQVLSLSRQQQPLPPKPIFFGKLLHGLISAGLIYGVSQLLGWDVPVSEYLATQVSTLAELNFHRALTVSTATAMVVWLILTAISMGILLKCYGNRQQKRI